MICPFYTEPLYFFYVPDLPVLIYYAYLPAIITALLIGMIVFWNDRKALLNRLLVGICFSFLVWTFATLVTWVNINSNIVLFAWSFLGPAAGFLSIFSIYFTYVFLEKKDVGLWLKMTFAFLLAPLVILAASPYTLRGFNLVNCGAFGFEGLTNTFYFPALGALAIVWILGLLVRHYRRATNDFKKQILLFGTGVELFLFSFFTTEFLGQYLFNIGLVPDTQLETYGYFGMIIFTIYIGILIVRFKTFHVNLIATQALVLALLVLIASELAFVRNPINFVLVGITLFLTLISGFFLIRSVKREIQLREEVEQLATSLDKANENLQSVNAQQENLLHFVSHEVKGYLNKSAVGFAAIVEGDMGPVSDTVKTMSQSALTDVRKGVATVMDILAGANLKKGTFTYNKAPFDLKKAVQDTVQDLQSTADEKKLKLTVKIGKGVFTVNGDADKIQHHVIRNIIDNSIKYTPAGSIQVSLTREGDTVRFIVEDTGVGITPEDMQHLFTEGGHGKDSLKVNVHSTGFGLFIAKQVTEAHDGKIKAESEGQGKGSCFTVELPAT